MTPGTLFTRFPDVTRPGFSGFNHRILPGTGCHSQGGRPGFVALFQMNTTPEPTETELSHEERPHAKRSSSQLGSLALCPGFRPKQTKKTHWVTAQGNRGHAALDTGETDDLESTFEQRMVKLCEDYTAKLPPAAEQHEEIKVNTIEGRWGYTDRLRIRAEDTSVADLLDWKFVRQKEVVDAEINLQGKDYVVGIFEDARFCGLGTIHVHFVMPRLMSVTTATYTRDDVPRLKLEIFAVLRIARRTDSNFYKGADLNPHYDVCKYCGASGNCVALRRIYDGLARAYDPAGYGKLPPVPTETHASQIKDPVARGQLQVLASVAEDWAASVRHHNLSAALDNAALRPAGYDIDYAQGKRRVTNPAALVMVAKEFNLDITDLVDAATISWTKVERSIMDNAPRGTKAKVVGAFNQRLLELDAIERPEPHPKLVKSRPSPSS